MATSPSLRRSPIPSTQRSHGADSDFMSWYRAAVRKRSNDDRKLVVLAASMVIKEFWEYVIWLR